MEKHLVPIKLLAFLLELMALVFLVLWAWKLELSVLLRLLVMALALAALIVPWTLFLAPKAPRKFKTPGVFLGKLALLTLPGLLLFRGQLVMSLAWAALVLLSLLMSWVNKLL